MKKRLFSILQLALGVGLITFLFYRMDNKADLLDALKDIAGNRIYFAGSLLGFLVCIIMCTLRWRLILKAHGINISVRRALNLYFIGQFFNAFMLGSVGGDIVKAVIVTKEFPDKKTVAVTTIFIDRLIGLLSLVLLASTVTILRFKFFKRYPETRTIMLFMIAAAAVSGIMLFMAFHRNILEYRMIAAFINRYKTVGGIINRVYSAFQDCFTHRGLITRTVLLSLCNHIAIIGSALMLGMGLNISTTGNRSSEVGGLKPEVENLRSEGVELKDEIINYLTVFPIINGVAAIPATPGGLGTREYATKFMMGLPEFNVPETRAITLSLLLYLTTMFWSLAGGLFYAAYVIRTGSKPKPTDQSTTDHRPKTNRPRTKKPCSNS